MFRSVVVSHDGSRSIEETLGWLEPLLGESNAHVELYGRRDAEAASELNSPKHLAELADRLSDAGAEVKVLPADYDLVSSTSHRLVVVHDPSLALQLLRDSHASVFFSPEGASPHVPKRILVPLDGSKFAEAILPLLLPFCRAFEPTVELLKVAEEEEVAKIGSLMAGSLEPDALHKRQLDSLESGEKFLKEHGANVVSRLTEPGAVHRRILETAAADQADLIAVSTHGHNRVARWLFRSTAEQMIKAGTTPLLVRNTRE
jgi:nucleotide-binding universal stress UspA family protein